jgi:hypothetical protein
VRDIPSVTFLFTLEKIKINNMSNRMRRWRVGREVRRTSFDVF